MSEEFEEQILTIGFWPGGQFNKSQTKEIAFKGEKIWVRYDGDDRGTNQELYRGKEKFLYYQKDYSRWQSESSKAWKNIYDSFEEFKEDMEEELPTGSMQKIEKELGLSDGKEHVEI